MTGAEREVLGAGLVLRRGRTSAEAGVVEAVADRLRALGHPVLAWGTLASS